MPSKRKKKPAAPKPRWERPGQSTAEFAEEVAKRTATPFGMSQAGVDFLDNLIVCAVAEEIAADKQARENPDEAEFFIQEKAFVRGIIWAVKKIRNESTV